MQQLYLHKGKGKAAGYQDGVRWGEHYGAETALKLFEQAVRNNGSTRAADQS